MAAKYTVNEVEERTQVPSSTLRQWERRYGFPMPARSESGYRLYSDLDLEQISSMKRYIEDGVPASRAAALVKNAQRNSSVQTSCEDLAAALVEALVDLDEAKADSLLSEAYALHPIEKVLVEIIRPVMFELGERWHNAEINTTTEHFASSYIQGKMRGLFSLGGSSQFGPVVIVACAPKDQHELGALMLAILLRRKGYRVYFVGANTPIEDLKLMANEVDPRVVMISASLADSVTMLFEASEILAQLAPIVIFGGAAFDEQPGLAKELGGEYLSADLLKAVGLLADLVNEKEAGA
ncbi:MAG: cobalamin-dependent protein [Trueperaceae bacterium]|nr:cobalamin-dependent protein [Trueperaceae bacterium]